MLLHQRFQQRVVEPTAPDDRAICLQHHPPLLAPLDDVRTAKPGMQFPLTYTDLTTLVLAILAFELLDVRLKLIEMVNAVVRYTQRADLASLLRFD